MTFDPHTIAEGLLKSIGIEGDYSKTSTLAKQLEDTIDTYREQLIKNYIAGDWAEDWMDREIYAGCQVMEVGEADGLVIITKSLKQAIKAFKAYWKCTDGDVPEFKESDFGAVRVWVYKRPEREGCDPESYFDFTSDHPKARDGFVIYY